MRVNNSPILPLEFVGWMEGIIHPANSVAIAVSGGADSMALLILTHEWAAHKNIKIIALTVNHNLRVEAQQEAEKVGEFCAKIGVEHHILRWEHSQLPTSKIQESARDARYVLMCDFCHKNHIKYLLTAHHLGDQIETFFFRLARGSGLNGLACMFPQTIKNGINLLRPLLCVPKTRLIATLKAKNQEWIEDPTNQNTNYTRVRIRKSLQDVTSDNLSQRVSELTSKLQKFRTLTEKYIEQELKNNVEFQSQHTILHTTEKLSEPALSKLVQILNGSEYPPRSEKLARLYSEIYAALPKTRSFAGLLFKPIKGNKTIIYSE